MKKPVTQLDREWMAAWQRAAVALEAMRRDDIVTSGPDGIRAVIPTADLLRRLGVTESAETGLIEQQRWFSKLRHG